MKLIKTIKFLDLPDAEFSKYQERKAARAVVFDSEGKMALLFVAAHNYHKLPGGGADEGEEIEETLKRECLEEIGCTIEVKKELGEIIEYRDKWQMKNHSFCFIAHVIGEKGEPDFTDSELKRGFQIKWVSVQEALNLMEKDEASDYEAGFIKIRDIAIVKTALGQITS